MKTNLILSAALVSGALLFGGSASAAGVLTFNPQATNAGCTNLAAGSCVAVDAATPAYDLDNAIINYVGVLDIAQKYTDPLSGSTWGEAGNILIENFKLGNVVVDSNVWRGATGNYDIYAKFTTTGSGIWLNASSFSVTSIDTLIFTLYASPATGTAQTLGDASSGFDATGGIGGFGDEDFVLGVGNIIAGPNQASAAIDADGTATTSLNALLDFVPAAGVSGLTGFLAEPNPFEITIGSQAGGNANNTTWAALGANGIRISTLNDNRGGGSLAFTTLDVPEPSALALVGVALVGLGLSRRRKSATV